MSAGKDSATATGERLGLLNVPRVLFALGGAILFVIMWALYTRLAWTVPMNSDHATALLQANDFVHGNYLLRGWIAGNMSVYTTELPLYVVGLIVAGFTPSLLRVVPALQFTIVLALSMWLTYRETRAHHWRHALILTFILVALPCGFATWMLLVSFEHIGTITMVLAAFLTFTLINESSNCTWLYPLFLALMTCAIMDDELALYIGALPIAIVLATKAVLEWPRVNPKRLALAAITLVSAPLGFIIADLISRVGGFVAFAPRPAFASRVAWFGNASLAFRGVLFLFGADPFDRFGLLGSLPFVMSALVHVLGIIVVVIGAWQVLVRLVKGERSDDLVSTMLVLAIAIDLACFIVSDRPVEIGSARYLTPVVVFGAVMAGIEVSPIIAARRFRWPIVAVATIYIATFAQQLFSPRANQQQRIIVRWLEQHGLTEGYGDFWAAGILTAESGGTVKIRQVMANDTGYHPLRWMANQSWYTTPRNQGTFNFLVLDNSNVDNVNEESARKYFGTPKEEYQVAGYTILIWDKRPPLGE